MDPNQIVALTSGLFTGPYGPLLGIAIILGYQWAKKRFPVALSKLPSLTPSSTPSPTPALSPALTPVPSTNHPALEVLLKLVGGARAAAVLAEEVKSMIAEPEAATPVKSS